jgi:hypothetical protein
MDMEISNIFESRWGKRYFNIDNYKFSEYHVLMSGCSNFRWSNKKSSVSVIVNTSKSNKIIKVTNYHSYKEYNNQR